METIFEVRSDDRTPIGQNSTVIFGVYEEGRDSVSTDDYSKSFEF